MNYPVVKLTEREMEVYGNYYQIIRGKMTDTHHYYRMQLVKALLLAMFYDMSNVIYRVGEKEPKKIRRSDAIFTEFIRLLEKHYRTQRRVYWYAQKLNITPKHLTDLVISVSKRSPNAWIDDYVVMEIRLQLKNTTKTIREIAKELNFPDQSLLGKYFKKNVGVSPLEYRRG
jgi:AraC-like DNA-binding protein